MKTRTRIKERVFFFVRIFVLVLLIVSTIKVWNAFATWFMRMCSICIICCIYDIIFHKELRKPNSNINILSGFLIDLPVFLVFVGFAAVAIHDDWNVLLQICYGSVTIGYFLHAVLFTFSLENIGWR